MTAGSVRSDRLVKRTFVRGRRSVLVMLANFLAAGPLPGPRQSPVAVDTLCDLLGLKHEHKRNTQVHELVNTASRPLAGNGYLVICPPE